jgi:hypothetical protein
MGRRKARQPTEAKAHNKSENQAKFVETRPDRTVLVACIAGAGAVVAASIALVGSLVTDDDPPPPPPGYCAEVLSKYRELVKGSEETVEFLKRKGSDGKSRLDRDQSAARCGLSGEDLATLSRVTQ